MSVYVEVLRTTATAAREAPLSSGVPAENTPLYVRGMHYYSAALAHLHAGLSQRHTVSLSRASRYRDALLQNERDGLDYLSHLCEAGAGGTGDALCYSPSSTARPAFAVSRTLSRDAMGPTHPLERASR